MASLTDNFDNNHDSYMVFDCSNIKYAISIDNVLEVMKLPALEYPQRLPNNSIGLLKYDNIMVNIFDIRFYFDVDIEKYDIYTKLIILKTDESIFGIIAQNISDIVNIEKDKIQQLPLSEDKNLVDAIYSLNNESVNILNAYTLEDLLKNKKSAKKRDIKALFPTDDVSAKKFEERANYLKEKNSSTDLQNIFSKEKFLSFSLNGSNYCMNLNYVKEIAKNAKISSLPCSADFVDGLIALRGKFYTVINLKSFLGLKKQDYVNKKNIIIINSEEFQLGFIVDKIYEIFELTEEEVFNDHFLNAAPFIFNEIVKNEKIYTILDMPDILNSDKMEIDDEKPVF